MNTHYHYYLCTSIIIDDENKHSGKFENRVLLLIILRELAVHNFRHKQLECGNKIMISSLNWDTYMTTNLKIILVIKSVWEM